MASDSLSRYKPMAISVDETFDRRSFTLSAVAMRKVNDIIVSRLPGELVFDVGYSDGTQLSELDLERVLGDDNPKRRSIKRIECYFGSGSKPAFDFSRRMLDSDGIHLTFDTGGDHYEPPISLRVSSPDRERVWLTVAELRDYLASEVAVRSRLPKWLRLTGIVCLVAACCSGLLLWGRTLATPHIQLPNLTEVIQNADPNAKLNYLLLRQLSADASRFPMSIVLAIAVVALLGFMTVMQIAFERDAILPFSLFPRSHFTIGKGAERYEKQRRLRTQLFWSVIVAFVVGVLSSVFLSLVTKP